MSGREKQALLFTTVAGSQIPDIDVISAWWDSAGRYQMWHRGLTHSVWLVPLWAGLLSGIARLIRGTRGWSLFLIAMLAVFIHDTSDLFNAWGTGYFEPFSPMRITFGTVPIIDFVFWAAMFIGFAVVRWGRRLTAMPGHRIYRLVWLVMALHVVVQTAQGYALYRQTAPQYEEVALSADFVPGVFTVIGKKGDTVDLTRGTLWTGTKLQTRLVSKENTHLERLFAENPKAKTLYEWSPFVVIVDDDKRLGLYDPRFYRNGQSFLFEFIDK